MGLCIFGAGLLLPIGFVAVMMVLISKLVGQAPPRPTVQSQSEATDQRNSLQQADAGFSIPVFQAYVNLLFSCLHQARGQRLPELIAGRFSPAVVREVEAEPSLLGVSDIVVGSQTVIESRVDSQQRLMEIRVGFEACYIEKHHQGTRQLYTQEQWTFCKTTDVPTPAPEMLLRLACPNCGQSTGSGPDGACSSCRQPTNQTRLQWLVTARQVTLKVPKPPLVFEGQAHGSETGTGKPTVYPQDFASQKRAFCGRHPDFDWSAFESRAANIFLNLQQAWSTKNFEAARPYEMDTLYDTHRFWIERYRAEGYTNHLTDIQVNDINVCLVEMDAYYERIVVRIFAQMKDWTSDRQGAVVAGDPNLSRKFSEYWTFLRRVGCKATIAVDLQKCPSCGAQLDNVNQNGICLYCQSNITSGNFDWVLSNIDQDETYQPTV